MKMRIKIKLAILLLFLIGFNKSYCQELTISEINTVVSNFLTSINGEKQLKSSSIPKTLLNKNHIITYIYEISSGGFVITSNNKKLPPILAYSNKLDTGDNFHKTNFYKFIQNDLEIRLENFNKISDSTVTKNNLLWDKYLNNNEDIQFWPDQNTTSTGGIIQTTWNQQTPYNNLYPIDLPSNSRYVVGCVNTAVSQVINHHKFIGNLLLNNSDTYISYGNNTIKFDSDSTMYDFPSFNTLNSYLDSIRKKYASLDEITELEKAALNLVCGIKNQSTYTHTNGIFETGATHSDAVELFNEIGYHAKYSIYNYDGYYEPALDIVRGLPVIASIEPFEGKPHSIIIDGYSSLDMYHINFGWGSNAPQEINDCWYSPPRFEGYYWINDVIYNIIPNETPALSIDVIELSPEFPIKELNISSSTDCRIDSIHCRYPFSISYDGNTFNNKISNLNLDLNKKIYIKQETPDSIINDFLHINYSNGYQDAIQLIGLPEGNYISSINGNIKNNGKPYFVTENIEINNQVTIEKGVKIYFLTETTLKTNNNGGIKANGSFDLPVLFSGVNRFRGWEGMKLSGSCIFKYSQFKNIINNNYSTSLEGGIRLDNSSEFYNCIFQHNDSRGGIACIKDNYKSQSKFVGCVFSHNNGKVMYICDSKPCLINCTISENIGKVHVSIRSGIEIINSIINQDLHYEWNIYMDTLFIANSYIKNLGDSTSIISEPNFKNINEKFGRSKTLSEYTFELADGSSGIEEGKNSFLPLEYELDLLGNPRIIGKRVDIGAYENSLNGAVLSTPKSIIEFGYCPIESTIKKVLTIHNIGNEEVKIDSTFMNNNVFKIASIEDLKNLTIESGDSINIEIIFKPDTKNNFSSVLDLKYKEFSKKILLKGTGVEDGIFVSGKVSGTWEKDKCYYVVGDIEVDSDLIIEEGVNVIFMGNYGFSSFGKNLELNTNSKKNPIVFKGLNNYWKGIRLSLEGSEIKMENIHFRDVDNGNLFTFYYDKNGETINFENCKFENINERIFQFASNTKFKINNCEIANCTGYFSNHFTTISNTDFILTYNYFNQNQDLHIGITTSNVIFEKNTIANNENISFSFDNATIIKNRITNNSSGEKVLIRFGGNSKLIKNVLTNNMNNCTWAPIFNSNGFSEVYNNTIANNKYSAGVIEHEKEKNSYLNFQNNIIWNNTKNEMKIYNSGGTEQDSIIIKYCLWQGGNNNGDFIINENPLFVNPSQKIGITTDESNVDWCLQSGSPCIDKGNPSEYFNDASDEMTGYPKFPALGTIRNDIGAYGGSFNNLLLTNINQSQLVPQSVVLCNDDLITIKRSSKKQYFCSVYNIYGRLILKKQFSGIENMICLKSQPSGIYILVINGDNLKESHKVVKTK